MTKSEPRTRLLLKINYFLVVILSNHENSRHLAEWRLLFLRAYTMIVTVYLPMWNVIRMVLHLLSEM